MKSALEAAGSGWKLGPCLVNINIRLCREERGGRISQFDLVIRQEYLGTAVTNQNLIQQEIKEQTEFG
jgi:hypothetical protein